MIVVYHHKNKVVDISNVDLDTINKANTLSIVEFLFALAKDHPEEILVWCHIRLKEQLNTSEIAELFHHKRLLFSYNPCVTHFIDKRIGYVEESPFIKVNKKGTYPTWQMSGMVGGIYGSTLLVLKNVVIHDKDFDYFLCSLAKLGMPKGLLCYSEPKLLKYSGKEFELPKSNRFTLFRFVKQHYKTRWVFLLGLNLMLYERKFSILPMLFSLFYRNRNNNNVNLDCIKIESLKKVVNKATIDVIVPTIGRKTYLYDFLCDLRNQVHLPATVIIVEQNPDDESESELDYLDNEVWPFVIKHTFTHQAGACNARNVALGQVSNEWVFLADDDIRIEVNFLKKALEGINKFGVKAVSLSCLQKGEKQVYSNVFQWGSFGSGCSMVFAESLKQCKFNMGYEFGFGEDGDFGRQLRNHGVDVLYFPEPEILHLKAPMGGFRTKPILAWHSDPVQPKPSPTVMLYQILHQTKEQISGYKTILFFKYYKHQKIKNPVKYYINFQKQWKRSVFWANELNKKE
ncbi:MAG: glycosyltransferase family 2 protein [Bacteroidetes bacterium HGW-Bacteroidetes-3]|nr:MAG: glycosyltransferase family 2 protein [Bacteroidetes bacterium HGW-Bacteroidetes-3]